VNWASARLVSDQTLDSGWRRPGQGRRSPGQGRRLPGHRGGRPDVRAGGEHVRAGGEHVRAGGEHVRAGGELVRAGGSGGRECSDEAALLGQRLQEVGRRWGADRAGCAGRAMAAHWSADAGWDDRGGSSVRGVRIKSRRAGARGRRAPRR